MRIDIIITTYNRSERARLTVEQFLGLKSPFFNRIILVDSTSNISRFDYSEEERVEYIRSSHKNQPYQRYLGYQYSNADVLLYLDDDMDLLDEKLLIKELRRFDASEVAGITFQFKNDNVFLAKMPKNLTAGWGNPIGRALKWMTGAPILKPNTFWLCGLRGQRQSGHPIEYVQGGAFAVRRDALYQNFNFGLFDAYEARRGKGEDVVLGYGLSKQGHVWAADGEVFYHNDQLDSSYTPDLISFNRRVAFSRLQLSLEYSRLNHNSFLVAKLHYHWYMLWRTMASIISVCFKPSHPRCSALKGWIQGWVMATFWKPGERNDSYTYWLAQAQQDLKHGDP